MMSNGLVTEAAVLERGLAFELSPSGCKQLRDLGLLFLARHSGNLGGVQAGRHGGKGSADHDEVVVDLLSLVCARGYSQCAVALINMLSEDSLTALRAAGRLHQPLKIAMHTGDSRLVRHLLLRLCPSLPLPRSRSMCLLDISPSSLWMSGGVAQLAQEDSVLLHALGAGRWEAVHEVLDYLVRLLSLSPSESCARQFAFGGAGAGERNDNGRGASSQSAGGLDVGGLEREKMFKRWVDEAVFLGREVALGEAARVQGGESGEACSSIVALLDGLPAGDVRDGSDLKIRNAAVIEEWRYDRQASQLSERVTGRGHDLDANTWRIVAAMQHVVDTRDRGSCLSLSAAAACGGFLLRLGLCMR